MAYETKTITGEIVMTGTDIATSSPIVVPTDSGFTGTSNVYIAGWSFSYVVGLVPADGEAYNVRQVELAVSATPVAGSSDVASSFEIVATGGLLNNNGQQWKIVAQFVFIYETLVEDS